jgi:Zn2+/Cd2+-exporting ATPase
MSDDLHKVPHAIALGRQAVRVIKQNIALALIVKGAFLLLGILGWSSLWLAILADDGVTLIVVLNSLRVLGFRDPYSAGK